MGAVIRQIWDRDAQEIWIYVAIITCTLSLYLFKDYLRILWTIFRLRGPPVLPIVGNADWICKDDLLDYLSHKAYNQYGPIGRFWISVLPYVLLFEPEDVQAVLGSSKNTSKIFLYRLLQNFLGKGLITSDVDTWRTHRRVIQPAFHLQVLQKFIDSFAGCSDRLANKLSHYEGQQLDITKLVNDAVYEILNETVLGVDVASKADKNGVIDLDDLPFRKGQMVAPYRMIHPWLLIDWIYRMTSIGKQEEKQSQDLSEACRRLLNEMRASRQASASSCHSASQDEAPMQRRTSLLEYMLEASKRNPDCFTDDDIVNECCTFMLAGQDSVSTATAMTLFLLANHPEWQSKCADELQEIFGAEEDECDGSSSRRPTMQDLRAMRCLEACIKEALRLYPSVSLFARTLGEDVKASKHILPAGCGVIILPYVTHRLPHHFPDPHSFRPERFSAENSEKRHPYAYLPFSAGPRNCIGNKFAILEIKAMISAILRRFTLSSIDGRTEVRPKFRLTVRASGGLWVKLSRRTEKR